MNLPSRRGFILPLLLVIIALLFVGGGAYVYEQNKLSSPVMASSTAQVISTAQTSSQLVVDPKTAKVGDTFGPFTITGIKTYSDPDGSVSSVYISYSGAVTVTGDVSFNEMFGDPCITLTETERQKLPLVELSGDWSAWNANNAYICLPSGPTKTFPLALRTPRQTDAEISERMTIEIKDYKFAYAPKEIVPTAELVRVIQPAQVTSTVQSADWKMYRNDDFKFQLRYPASWVVNEDPVDGGGWYFQLNPPQKSVTIGVDAYPAYWVDVFPAESLEDWFSFTFKSRETDSPELMPKKNDIVLNGLPAFEIQDPITEGGCNSEYIAVYLDPNIYLIQNPNCSLNPDIIKVIHSSFEFIY